jgi:hypothetical protein
MFKKTIEKLSNPLLYYVDKNGVSVFKNFCIFKNTGNLYRVKIPKSNAGMALEYRLNLNKILKRIEILTPIILYFIFIHINFSILNILYFEILWLGIILGTRIFYSKIYSEFLISHFGKYELTEFIPPISQSKKDEYISIFYSKIILVMVLLGLFCLPSIFIQWRIKTNLISQKHNYNHAVKLANSYFMFYPKSLKVYDMRALGKFLIRDYEGALADYKIALNISGKKFSKEDYTRFENLLYLQKKVTNPQDAVDVFNEYITKKDLSVMDESKMLWIKSIFQIENHVIDSIVQDYDDVLASLDEKDMTNQFYISSDKAYMLYLLQRYIDAINIYNVLIPYAQANSKKYSNELKSLYAERGFAKKQIDDIDGANSDFELSTIKYEDLKSFEPSYSPQKFVIESF